MSRATATRKPAATAPAELANLDQAALLEQALTLPGSVGSTYSRFTNYSMGNIILLAMQGVSEPVAGFRKWQSLNRFVRKGSKAKWIQHPMIVTVTEEGERKQKLVGFKLKPSVFVLSDTEGEDLPPVEPRTWDKTKALGALGITEVPYSLIDGNIAGYSEGRNVAINPVTPEPFSTLIHECAHVQHGHTSPEHAAQYRTHRGLKEFEAEATAYLVMNELDLQEHFDAAESRGYIQNWLRGERPPEASIRKVFAVTDQIIRAGLIELPSQEETA